MNSSSRHNSETGQPSYWNVSPGTVSNAIKKLQAKGFIEKPISDGRTRTIFASEKLRRISFKDDKHDPDEL